MIKFKRGMTINANMVEVRKFYADLNYKVGNYSDVCLGYFDREYESAMDSFQLWYDRQPKADAFNFTSVGDIIIATIKLLNPAIGRGVAPIWATVKLFVKQSIRSIQSTRNNFANSLKKHTIIFRRSMERQLIGQVPKIIKELDPNLWKLIDIRARNGEPWEPLLHQNAGLPKKGVNYQLPLLSNMIFKYRRWEFSQKDMLYREIIGMGGKKYWEAVRQRSRKEASKETNLSDNEIGL